MLALVVHSRFHPSHSTLPNPMPLPVGLAILHFRPVPSTTYLLSFDTLAHSFASCKRSTPLFSSKYALFHKNTRGGGVERVASKLALARARAQRTRRQWPGAHAEARAERRRNVAKKIAAAGAAAVAAERDGDVSAQPVAARFAHRINALHGEAGQVLHFISLRGRQAQAECPQATGGRL